jgi:phosphatidylserine decarboxylase
MPAMKLPIFKEGIVASGVCAVLAALCYLISFLSFGHFAIVLYSFSVLLLTLLFPVLFFYRDPERNIPANDKYILSPADGKILDIQKNDNTQIIKIFMSPLNIHVQRAPASGSIKAVHYKKGTFRPAYRKEVENENEQNDIIMSTVHGDIEIKQIAGILARRIACWVDSDDKVAQGQRIGMIRLGSQVEVSFSSHLVLIAKIGDKVKAGVTVIAKK